MLVWIGRQPMFILQRHFSVVYSITRDEILMLDQSLAFLFRFIHFQATGWSTVHMIDARKIEREAFNHLESCTLTWYMYRVLFEKSIPFSSFRKDDAGVIWCGLYNPLVDVIGGSDPFRPSTGLGFQNLEYVIKSDFQFNSGWQFWTRWPDFWRVSGDVHYTHNSFHVSARLILIGEFWMRLYAIVCLSGGVTEFCNFKSFVSWW